MSERPDLRAADHDRDRTAEHLRAQHAEGRLDTDELQHRIDRCYDAKTLGELDQLVSDLPPAPGADRPSARQPGAWPPRLVWLVPLVVALAAVCAVTGRHVIWLVIPLLLAARFLRGSQWYRHHDDPASGAS